MSIFVNTRDLAISKLSCDTLYIIRATYLCVCVCDFFFFLFIFFFFMYVGYHWPYRESRGRYTPRFLFAHKQARAPARVIFRFVISFCIPYCRLIERTHAYTHACNTGHTRLRTFVIFFSRVTLDVRKSSARRSRLFVSRVPTISGSNLFGWGQRRSWAFRYCGMEVQKY